MKSTCVNLTAFCILALFAESIRADGPVPPFAAQPTYGNPAFAYQPGYGNPYTTGAAPQFGPYSSYPNCTGTGPYTRAKRPHIPPPMRIPAFPTSPYSRSPRDFFMVD